MIVLPTDVAQLRNRYGKRRVVFAFGTFDLLHVGHLAYLEWCKTQGDVLVVAINCDRKVAHRKGAARPIIPEGDRLRMISALKVVDAAVLADWQQGEYDATFVELAHGLQPDVICFSSENSYALAHWAKAVPRATIVLDPQEKQHSSTAIIRDVVARHTKH